MARPSLKLVFLLAAASAAVLAAACCCISTFRNEVKFGIQTNIVVWNPETHIEHFIRQAKFTSSAPDVGFIAPTPTRPDLVEVSEKSFSDLAGLKPKPPREWGPPAGTVAAAMPKSVQVVQEVDVAGLHATTLLATDAKALSAWMSTNGYVTSPDVENWTKKYIAKRWYLTAFKMIRSAAPVASLQKPEGAGAQSHRSRPATSAVPPQEQPTPPDDGTKKTTDGDGSQPTDPSKTGDGPTPTPDTTGASTDGTTTAPDSTTQTPNVGVTNADDKNSKNDTDSTAPAKPEGANKVDESPAPAVAKAEPSVLKTSVIRMTFKTDEPFNPYYVPPSNFADGSPPGLDLYLVTPGPYVGFVGASDPWLNAEWSAPVPDDTVATLANDLKLKTSDIPHNPQVQYYHDKSFPNAAPDDLFFAPVVSFVNWYLWAAIAVAVLAAIVIWRLARPTPRPIPRPG